MSPSNPGREHSPRIGDAIAWGREDGFVLLEILMALVIFATLVLAYAKATDNALGIFLIGYLEHPGPLVASVFRQPIVNLVRR